jgi:UDP-N-acetylmuramate: L-alanyl-gamma-D-glutamyl-meso-diaminopimelate ligase
MRLHILGICGTFMSGIALIARQQGHDVSGSDMNVYPPMSTQLANQGIKLMEGYDPAHIDKDVDCVIIGNVIRRGNPAMEYVLSMGIPYISGPEWLAQHVLCDRWVLAVSGTHGKTTTTSLLTWILEQAGYEPGFLIGGIPENFGISARLGRQPYFVIEADEYDSAFFDKRSKFLHYRPKTAIINNLEFDHADIFPDLAAIKQQFHYFVRTIPGNGLIIRAAQDENIDDMLKLGCWTETITIGDNGTYSAEWIKSDGSIFNVQYQGETIGVVNWTLLGRHNIHNALAALAAAHHAGVDLKEAIHALSDFKNVKRRLEIKGSAKNIVIYDDFAHHPTAIATTLAGLRAKIGQARLVAVLEFGSYTMRSGVHKERIEEALKDADIIVCKATESDWGLNALLQGFKQPTALYNDIEALVNGLTEKLLPGDHVVVMSNSGFGGVHDKLLQAIENR